MVLQSLDVVLAEVVASNNTMPRWTKPLVPHVCCRDHQMGAFDSLTSGRLSVS